jgi:ribonuclease HI
VRAAIVASSFALNQQTMMKTPNPKSQISNPDYVIYTDGGSRGNPGPSAAAYVIADDRSKLLTQGGIFLGTTTNNVAEYQAVLIGLKAIIQHRQDHPLKLHFFGDSELIIRQLSGIYKIKQPHLIKLHQAIVELLSHHRITAVFNYIPRAQNSAADALVNQILDKHTPPMLH